VGFLAKDEPMFAAAAASFLIKKAAEKLALRQGFMFNSDDLVDMVPEIYKDVIENL
jgi:NAD(P)H-hydrate repair Nnr-like enzyme with NAD(P)H-hydrate dehydratase domain